MFIKTLLGLALIFVLVARWVFRVGLKIYRCRTIEQLRDTLHHYTVMVSTLIATALFCVAGSTSLWIIATFELHGADPKVFSLLDWASVTVFLLGVLVIYLLEKFAIFGWVKKQLESDAHADNS